MNPAGAFAFLGYAMNKSFAVIDIKSMNEEQRIVSGIATTPDVDRMGDSVNPLGVKVAGDIPLFLYHDSKLTVGRAKFGKATKAGIPFEARIPKVSEEGALKLRADEAWQLLKYQLITCVSIGFNVLNDAYERIKETGGYIFNEVEVLELSLVPIPALPSAVITGLRAGEPTMRRTRVSEFIKSISDRDLAALGHQGSPPGDRHRPGASGQPAKPPTGGFFHSRSQKGTDTMKTLKELTELRNTRVERQNEITKAWEQADHERTDEERDELDEIDTELKGLDDDIRMARMHARHAANAKGVDGGGSERGSASRGAGAGGMSFVRKQDPDDTFKGQAFTRYLIAKAMSFIEMKDGNFVSPVDVAKHRWGKSHPKLVDNIKAAVAGGGTDSGEWGSELAQADTRFAGDFVEFLYSMTVFDKLPLRPMPENVHVKGQDGAATGYWVGQSKAIPVSAPSASDVELQALQVGAIAVCSKKLIRNSSPSAELFIRDSIVQASAQRVDTTFFSTAAAVSGVSPAGILNGLSALAPSGTDAAAVRADMMSLYSSFLTGKNASGLIQIMTPSMAKALALLVNALGQPEFVGLNANGGTLLGDPVYTGDNVTPGDWILMKPSDIWKIGDSGVQVSMSDQATIEQDSAPQGATDTPVAASATITSMWQTESVAFKAVRSINYQLRRAGAVAVLSNAEYGGVVS